MAQPPSQEEIDNFFDFGQATSTDVLDSQILQLSNAELFGPSSTASGVVNETELVSIRLLDML